MAKPKWTILIVNDDGLEVRHFRFSREMMRSAVIAGLMAVAALVLLAAQVVMRVHGPTEGLRPTRENTRLKSQLSDMQKQVTQLNATMDALSSRDSNFRLVAGLEPLPAEVQRAGIGGPDGASVQRNPLWPMDPTAAELAHRNNLDVGALLRRARMLSSSWREARDSLKYQHERLAHMPSIQPTDGYISSAFSRWRFHPILNLGRAHEGIDISAEQGTPIRAAAKGRVRFAGRNGEFGLSVEIDHGFNTVTRYAHASKLLVRAGQSVKRGETIALVGSTGLAVGPHLHYEVLVGGRPVNPRQYLTPASAIPD
jgi:murein DD-endopeptidase MepM/ murein hydrolase activator NlpD